PVGRAGFNAPLEFLTGFTSMSPRSCKAYYYGGLPFKGTRRKGKLWVEGEALFFHVPEEKGNERIDLKIPFSRMSDIFLTRDNYYGSDTVLFNLTFRDQSERPFTLRFAPVALIPRRRIALQKEWFDYLASLIRPVGSASSLSTR
ncbi:MAG: hypothetical protein QME90_03520, partial [Thermodesulfobacteriota bacterium]|nr:hypothetical protein [Thermodesulfobacteriota bacterium]